MLNIKTANADKEGKPRNSTCFKADQKISKKLNYNVETETANAKKEKSLLLLRYERREQKNIVRPKLKVLMDFRRC